MAGKRRAVVKEVIKVKHWKERGDETGGKIK